MPRRGRFAAVLLSTAAVAAPVLAYAGTSTGLVTGTAVAKKAKGPTKTEVKAGKSIFAKDCASCHGPKGTGTSLGADLKKAPRAKSVNGVIQQLTKPITMPGFKVKMPSFKSKLSAKQKKQVAAFVTVDISKKVKAAK